MTKRAATDETAQLLSAGAAVSTLERTHRPPPAPRRSVPGWRTWLLQGIVAIGFYAAYVVVRDWHGTASSDDVAHAQAHGLAVRHLERVLHLDVEQPVQHLALRSTALVRALDVFYGTLHFVVTCAVFVGLLVVADGAVFRRARNLLALTTAVALVCFALYPTMPPRLLPTGYGYHDTMATVGGLWSYNNGVMEHISDPFAAMPSLHIAWATWCSVALWPLLRRRWQRSLLVGYPFLTAFTVLATGTHWLLDLVAGGAALAMAWLLLRWRPRRNLDTSWRGLGGGASVRPGIVDSDDAHTG